MTPLNVTANGPPFQPHPHGERNKAGCERRKVKGKRKDDSNESSASLKPA